MKYKTEYKVVSGVKAEFEAEINKLESEGFIWQGGFNTNQIEDKHSEKHIFYSALMSKTTEIK